MRKFTISMVAAMLGTAVLIGGLTSAAAKPRGGAGLLSLCISNYNACMRYCQDLPYYDWHSSYCANGCWDNHAACVDSAFNFARVSGNSTGLGVQPGTSTGPAVRPSWR